MNKLEEIKKKLDDLAYWGDISPNKIENDIEYLLSIIEQAEKALEHYVNMSINPQEGQLLTDWLKESTLPAREALQAIRKGD